ncbi:hypothetical protein NGRA_2797 [Nosema granulosis]|uniref:Peptidase M16 N-terminal domain-containing protein n=1 Tax=Nosema granulosis TaxID=83296 RepID=A0A9P6GWF3_9MICR|nr:hypothetical protein NGRA_2797 [Nosema granulosis]
MLFVYVLLCLSSSFDHVDHLTILENSKKKTVDQFDNGMKLFYIQDTKENMSIMSFRIEIDDNPLNIELYHLLEHCIIRGHSFFKEFIIVTTGNISANTNLNNMKILFSVPTIYFLESIELFYKFIYKLNLTKIFIKSEIMSINEEFIGKNLAENPFSFYKFYRLTGNSENLNENYFDWYYNCYLKKGVFLDRKNVKHLDNIIVEANKEIYYTYRQLISYLYNTKFKKSPFSLCVKTSLPLDQIKKKLKMFNNMRYLFQTTQRLKLLPVQAFSILLFIQKTTFMY